MKALNARVLQTELMVAALSCGQREEYNTFVRTFRPKLVSHGRALRALFMRTHGSGGNKELNAFVTRLANNSSQESLTIGAGYCQFAVDLFGKTLATSVDNFDNMTANAWIEGRHGFTPCGQAVAAH